MAARKRTRAAPHRPRTRERTDTTRVGKRGQLVLPISLRKRLGLDEGALVVLDELAGGILVRPAKVVPRDDLWSDEKVASFLLSGAVDDDDYRTSLEEVRRLGLDPAKVPHMTPDGRRLGVGPRIR